MAAICTVGVAAAAAFAAIPESGPPPNVSAPATAASKTGLPVGFAPVEQFRRQQGTCTTGWLPGPDCCFRLAANMLRVDNPREVELRTDPVNDMPVVLLTMSDSDAARFRQITTGLVPRQGMLGVVVDDRVVSAPVIKSAISGPSIEIVTSGSQETVEMFHQIK